MLNVLNFFFYIYFYSGKLPHYAPFLLMINAPFILVIIVVILLVTNHFNSNKGVLWAIIGMISACIKIQSEFFLITEFLENPIILRLILMSGLFGFLIGPSVLLYIKSILKKPAKLDFLLVLFLIAPVLYVVNLIPYYQLPLTDQIQVFQNQSSPLINKATFWISWESADRLNNSYNAIVGAMIMIYPILLVTRKKHMLSKKSYILIVQICYIILVNYAVLLFILFNKYFHLIDFNKANSLNLLSLILPLSILLFPRYLFDNINNSDLTFYLRLINHISVKEDKTDENQDKLVMTASRILTYLHNERPYLSESFSKHDIARNLDIPQNIVTDCFSKIIKIPFPVLRNQLRVEFAIEKFENSGHLKITIAGISSESGFKNRGFVC